MEMVLFIGIQASGKSTFYNERFSATHTRVNLDTLKTRHREKVLLRECLAAQRPFVVDNTNVTVAERLKYIAQAKAAGFKVVGYYFATRLKDALARNSLRQGTERIPDLGVMGTSGRLEIPTRGEGFDCLYYVRPGPEKTFIVEEWRDEL